LYETAGAHVETILCGWHFEYPQKMVSLKPLNVEIVKLLGKKQTPILMRPGQSAYVRRLLFHSVCRAR
jgi:hypothetical protein